MHKLPIAALLVFGASMVSPAQTLPTWQQGSMPLSRFAVVQIRKAKFRLRSLWLREALAAIFAHSDRLQCGGNEPSPAVGPLGRFTARWLAPSVLTDIPGLIESFMSDLITIDRVTHERDC